MIDPKTTEDETLNHLVNTYGLTLEEARLILLEHGADPDRMNGIAGRAKAGIRK